MATFIISFLRGFSSFTVNLFCCCLPRRKKNSPTPEPQGDEVDAKKLSVAERIFHMESKIEEEKFSTPVATSGLATPRLTKLRYTNNALNLLYLKNILKQRIVVQLFMFELFRRLFFIYNTGEILLF